MSVYNTTIYFIYFKIVYRQGEMFRPSLGHPQALKENGSLTIYYFEVYGINCCVIDWHICVFYKCQNTSGWQILNKLEYIYTSRNWKNVKFKYVTKISRRFLIWFNLPKGDLFKYNNRCPVARAVPCGYSGPITTVLRGKVSNEADKTRTTLFWGITQTLVAISYRRFGATYRSHFQRSRLLMIFTPTYERKFSPTFIFTSKLLHDKIINKWHSSEWISLYECKTLIKLIFYHRHDD